MREEASAWRNRNYNLLIMVLKVPSLRLCIPKLLMPSVSKTSYALEIVAPIFSTAGYLPIQRGTCFLCFTQWSWSKDEFPWADFVPRRVCQRRLH
jgi:hypothetical protein